MTWSSASHAGHARHPLLRIYTSLASTGSYASDPNSFLIMIVPEWSRTFHQSRSSTGTLVLCSHVPFEDYLSCDSTGAATLPSQQTLLAGTDVLSGFDSILVAGLTCRGCHPMTRGQCSSRVQILTNGRNIPLKYHKSCQPNAHFCNGMTMMFSWSHYLGTCSSPYCV